MTYDVHSEYSQLYDKITENLDIPPNKYKQAVDRYTAVGKWLEEGNYGSTYDLPHIYPQGSFRLGTVVRPIREGKEADYDIDLVCELQKEKNLTSPQEIKDMIGSRLRENATYRGMLDDEGRRCWTLLYAEEDGIGFHLDVLPSVPESDQSKLSGKAIAITHREARGMYRWSASDPNGYADWFHSINRPVFEILQFSERRRIFEENTSVFAKVDDVPDQLVKTPLQRAIQLLKRHRDQRFSGHDFEGHKPISMILTTLSAQLYNQEQDVPSALQGITEQLEAYSNLVNPGWHIFRETYAGKNVITRLPDGKWYIPNPVNHSENFADRWHENDNKKAKSFFQWVAWVRQDLIEVLDKRDVEAVCESLKPVLGTSLVRKASKGLFASWDSAIISGKSDDYPSVEIKNPSKPWGVE